MSRAALSRIKFCSTGVPSDQRHDIASKVTMMGGSHEVNLLSDVKFLIVGSRDTDKFRFSVQKRFDMAFIEPEQVVKIYEKWMRHERFNLDNFRMKPFKGLKVCISRLAQDPLISKWFQEEDIPTLHASLVDLIESGGGEASTSLSYNHSCIITNDLNGKKYEMAVKWNLPVLHPIWVLHSVKRRMSLHYADYDVINLDTSRIEHVWEEIANETNKKRNRDNDTINEAERELIIKRKNPEVWRSIMTASTSVLNTTAKNEWDDDEDSNDKEKRPSNPFNSISIPQVSTSSILNPQVQSKSHETAQSNLFKGKTFLLKFFRLKEQNILHKIIKTHNGTVVNHEYPELDFVIVPSDFEVSKIPSTLLSYEILTEWFIERSLHFSTLKIDQWGKPFYRNLTHFEKLKQGYDKGHLNLAITGFQGIELLHITKMIEKMLIVSEDEFIPSPLFKLNPVLNKDVDLLIINIDNMKLHDRHKFLIERYPTLFKQQFDEDVINPKSLKSTRSKIAFAKSHDIPIVTISFLFEFFLREDTNDMITLNYKSWCIFCPKSDRLQPRIRTLCISYEEIIQKQASEPSQIPKTQLAGPTVEATTAMISHQTETLPSDQESVPKLPSPIRNKRHKSTFRIIGRATVSHLNNPKSTPSYNDKDNLDLDENDGELRATQISYDDGQAVVGYESDAPKRRATRQVYKDLVDLSTQPE